MGNVLPVTAVLRSTERMTVDFQFARYRGSSLLPVPAVNILKPGDVILSGSFVKAVPFNAGDSLVALFDQLGEVTLRVD